MTDATFSLIQADNHFGVMAALFAIALFGFWAERQSWGATLTGAVWTILTTILVSNIGIIPKSALVYDFVFTWFVPVLVPLFLLHANVRKIIAESGRVGLAFILCCIGTVAGTLTAASVLDLGSGETELTAMLTGSFVSGSVNFAALIQATGYQDADMISATTAVDTFSSATFLAFLAMLPASRWLVTKFAERDHSDGEFEEEDKAPESNGFALAGSLAFAITVVAVSDGVVAWLDDLTGDAFDVTRMRYLFITIFSIIPASLWPRQWKQLEGGETIGLVLAFVFFAAIVAGADVVKLVTSAPVMIAFVFILLVIHTLVVFGGGYLWNRAAIAVSGKEKPGTALTLPELITASNAAVLVATTAPALAVARGWYGLATPGVLVGVAGYIVGTPLGLMVVELLEP